MARESPRGRVVIKAGVHKVAMVTAERGFTESDALLEAFIPSQGRSEVLVEAAVGGGRGGRGGGGGPASHGPYNPIGSAIDSPNRRRIFICHPSSVAQPASNAQPASDADETACASKIFANIAHRAFRRPVTDKDLAAPLAFFKEARATGNFEAGIQSGLMAILASPKFLYRAEASSGQSQARRDLPRQRFAIWLRACRSSCGAASPTTNCSALAEQGKLKDPKVFEQQVRRMLADPKAEALVTNFAFEWLRVREVDKLDPDAVVYPNFNADLRTAFKREMELWVGSIIHEDRSVLDLLTPNYTYRRMSGWRGTTAFRTSSAISSAA